MSAGWVVAGLATGLAPGVWARSNRREARCELAAEGLVLADYRAKSAIIRGRGRLTQGLLGAGL